MVKTLYAFSTYIIFALGIVATVGFLVLTWYWYRVGRASDAYASVTLIYLGIGITAWVAVIGRYLYTIEGSKAYEKWVQLPAWSIGPLILLAVLVRTLYVMVRRIVRTFLYHYGYLEDRRKQDRRQ